MILYGAGIKKHWQLLHHNGPLFPQTYEPHNIPIIIHNIEIKLSPLAEEYASMFARYNDKPDYYNNNKFRKNFWKDFKKTLNDLNNITLNDIDFSLIIKYLNKEKEKKLQISKEEKELLKKQQEELEEPYKYCIIDNIQQTVGNYKIEPPGIFIGRGNHPKLGRIKKRIMPEDVIINLSKDATIPKIEGHKWKKVIHDKSVIWLASWKEKITNKTKYIFTSVDSAFKSKSDQEKFDLARQLKKKINSIRETYETQLLDDELKTRQLSTALYLIDNLALRVGGTKNIAEEADTVGVSSLRVEHLSFSSNDDYIIKLDFLGKDSVRFCKKFAVHKNVYNNLLQFCQNKNKKDLIFDLISANVLNMYLNSFIKNLTSKVWRTYNASILFQNELNKIKIDKFSNNNNENDKLNYLMSMFHLANTSVAVLCNHQKNINSNINDQISMFDNKIKDLKNKINKAPNKEKKNKIKIKLNLLKLKKETKQKMANVSLDTSKNNYIDPRIIFSFIKKYNIPKEKIFTKKLSLRFKWAEDVDENYKF